MIRVCLSAGRIRRTVSTYEYLVTYPRYRVHSLKESFLVEPLCRCCLYIPIANLTEILSNFASSPALLEAHWSANASSASLSRPSSFLLLVSGGFAPAVSVMHGVQVFTMRTLGVCARVGGTANKTNKSTSDVRTELKCEDNDTCAFVFCRSFSCMCMHVFMDHFYSMHIVSTCTESCALAKSSNAP